MWSISVVQIACIHILFLFTSLLEWKVILSYFEFLLGLDANAERSDSFFVLFFILKNFELFHQIVGIGVKTFSR